MKPECVELVCSRPHAWNPVAAAFHKPSSKAARIARSASPLVSLQSDFERFIVDPSAGRNGSCARNIRTSESVADPTSVSDAVKIKRNAGAYVAHNSGTHSNSNFAPLVSVASTVVVGGAVIAAAPPSSSDEDKAATGGDARGAPFSAAEDDADGFSEGDGEDDDEEDEVANAARKRRRFLTLTRPDVHLTDGDVSGDAGVFLVFIVPLTGVVFAFDIDVEADVNIIFSGGLIGWITTDAHPVY